MSDRLALIATALAGAALGWIFWHYLADDAFSALPTIGLIIFAIDNVRLRRKLRSEKG